MGRLALLFVLSIAGIAIFHGSASGDGLRESARQAGEKQRLTLSRTAAKTGWARTKQALVADFKSDTLSGSNGPSSYETRVVVTGSEALVTSIGRTPIPGRAATTDYQIVYRLELVGVDDLPPFAEYAVAVEGNLDLSGNGAIVTPGVPGASGDSLSIRVHANGNLHAQSTATTVRGFGSYATSASGKLASTFQPRSNPDGAPLLSKTDSVSIPHVSPSEILATYRGTATVYRQSLLDFWTAQLVNRTLPGGTRDEPKVYYAQGNLSLTNVTVDGYAVFIAEGRVDIGGTVKGTPEPGLKESALSVFTPGEITMGGNSTVYGSLFAGGGLSYNGTIDIWGNLVVGGDFSHSGTATIHYRPAASSLYSTWDQTDPALKLLAYREQ